MIKPKRKRRREPIRFRQGDKVVCLPVERGELPIFPAGTFGARHAMQ